MATFEYDPWPAKRFILITSSHVFNQLILKFAIGFSSGTLSTSYVQKVYILSLLAFSIFFNVKSDREYGSSRWYLLSTSHAQNLYSHYSFPQFPFNANFENCVLHQFNTSGLSFFLEFDHSCIETIKMNESRNNECTYLRFDIPNSKPRPESKSRLRSKVARFSEMLPGEREGKNIQSRLFLTQSPDKF